MNALPVTANPGEVAVVVSGLGAAGVAAIHLLSLAGDRTVGGWPIRVSTRPAREHESVKGRLAARRTEKTRGRWPRRY